MTIDSLMGQFMELDTNTQGSVAVILGVAVIGILIRLVITLRYQLELSSFRMSKKEIKKKEDTVGSVSFLLNKIIRDFKSAGEKGIALINTEAIIKKHVQKLSFLGWNLHSMGWLLQGLEKNILLFGLIGVLIGEVFLNWVAGAAAVGFLLIHLAGAILDYESVREKLETEIEEYIDHQFGAFYKQDLGSSVQMFKIEMQSTLLNVSKTIRDSIEKMGTSLSKVVASGNIEMINSVDTTMKKLSAYGDTLKEPMEQWKETLVEAGRVQEQLKSTVESLGGTVKSFEKASGALELQMKTHGDYIHEEALEQKKEGLQLQAALRILEEVIKGEKTRAEAIEKQLTYLETNQSALDISLQQYQGVLEKMVKDMGEVLGHVVTFQGQKAAELLTAELQELMKQWTEKNSMLMDQVQRSFDQMNTQNAHGVQTIIHMKDQMDLSFQDIREKLSRFQES